MKDDLPMPHYTKICAEFELVTPAFIGSADKDKAGCIDPKAIKACPLWKTKPMALRNHFNAISKYFERQRDSPGWIMRVVAKIRRRSCAAALFIIGTHD